MPKPNDILKAKIECKLDDLAKERKDAIDNLVYSPAKDQDYRKKVEMLDYGISILRGINA